MGNSEELNEKIQLSSETLDSLLEHAESVLDSKYNKSYSHISYYDNDLRTRKTNIPLARDSDLNLQNCSTFFPETFVLREAYVARIYVLREQERIEAGKAAELLIILDDAKSQVEFQQTVIEDLEDANELLALIGEELICTKPLTDLIPPPIVVDLET